MESALSLLTSARSDTVKLSPRRLTVVHIPRSGRLVCNRASRSKSLGLSRLLATPHITLLMYVWHGIDRHWVNTIPFSLGLSLDIGQNKQSSRPRTCPLTVRSLSLCLQAFVKTWWMNVFKCVIITALAVTIPFTPRKRRFAPGEWMLNICISHHLFHTGATLVYIQTNSQ